ncbi:MAG: hypothetical protein LBK61_07920 [Spirochaetaceae bacterium]|nr:hypothetical protein [Spirochaetaceae bacterium]
MKRVLVLSAVLFTAFTIETYALGLGLQGGVGGSGGLSFLISPNEQAHGAVTWNFDAGMLGGSVDYWFWNQQLTALGPGQLSFFLGGGAYAEIVLGDSFGLDAGLRVPVGLDWRSGPVDVFLQIFPLIGLSLIPSPGFGGVNVGGSLGVRFWIN